MSRPLTVQKNHEMKTKRGRTKQTKTKVIPNQRGGEELPETSITPKKDPAEIKW